MGALRHVPKGGVVLALVVGLVWPELAEAGPRRRRWIRLNQTVPTVSQETASSAYREPSWRIPESSGEQFRSNQRYIPDPRPSDYWTAPGIGDWNWSRQQLGQMREQAEQAGRYFQQESQRQQEGLRRLQQQTEQSLQYFRWQSQRQQEGLQRLQTPFRMPSPSIQPMTPSIRIPTPSFTPPIHIR